MPAELNQRIEVIKQDIAHLNQKALLLARDLIRENPSQARMMFGLPDHLMDRLGELDLQSIERLAQVPMMVLKPHMRADAMSAACTAAEQGDDDKIAYLAQIDLASRTV